MLQREESRHDFAFIAGVIIGAIAGAIVTLALAPMSGNQTREAIRTRVNELPIDDFKHKADDLKHKAQDKAQDVKGKAADRASEVAHQAQPMMDKVKTQVGDIAAKTPLKSGNEAEDIVDEVAELIPPAPTSTGPTS